MNQTQKRRKTDLFKQTLKVMFHIIKSLWAVFCLSDRPNFLTESIVVSVSICEIAYTFSQETIHGFQQIRCREANNHHYCEGNE